VLPYISHRLSKSSDYSTQGYGPYAVGFYPTQYHNLLPHVYDWQFVGTQFLTEIYTMFYSKAFFHVSTAYDVESHLGQGVFYKHPTIAPYKYLRSLRVDLSCQIHPEDDHYSRYKSGIIHEASADKEDFERQIEYLSVSRV